MDATRASTESDAMAGDWMKIEKVTPDKPEIETMASRLSIDPDEVFGKCFRVWRWFDDHTTDGNAPSVTKSAVDRRAGIHGFADAMESVGWLTSSESGVSLPRFDRHNGETAKQRGLTAKRVATHKRKDNDGGNEAVTDDALPEKRREENTSTPLPPPPEPESAAAPDRDAEWEEAEAALIEVGVGTAAAAIDTAKRRGCQPVDVRRVIAHWRDKHPAWTPGAIVFRIGNLSRLQDPAEPGLWPKPQPPPVDTSAERLRVAAEHEAKRVAAARLLEASEAEQERLEREYGAKVDALNPDKIREIFAGNAFMLQRYAKDKKDGTIRDALLNHFDVSTTRLPAPA